MGTLSSEAGQDSCSCCMSGYNGLRNLRGLGTEVIDDVDVRIRLRSVSRAGRYNEVLGSYHHTISIRRSPA